jgi:hypothetical protein
MRLIGFTDRELMEYIFTETMRINLMAKIR